METDKFDFATIEASIAEDMKKLAEYEAKREDEFFKSLGLKPTRAQKIRNIKRKCKACGGPLVAIGKDRLNGDGSYADWKKRKYHMKCL